MLVNIDIRGDGGVPMCSTSRMSVYFTHAGMHEQAGASVLTVFGPEGPEPP